MPLENKWKAILLGGLIIGLAPFVPLLNLACCIIPVVGAMVTVAIYRTSAPVPLANRDGVYLGAMAGVVGTVIYAILIVPMTMFVGTLLGSFLGSLLPNMSEVPENIRPLLQALFSHVGTVLGVVLFFKVLGQLGLSVIFGILGGILGVALLKRRQS